ncbi:MAG: peptidyl-prolyl cis-trans isomerase [Bradymonadales bacterium]|nr:peptidyl-prolyl cis-trans isomerase [Bradymonadales bacterium]
MGHPAGIPAPVHRPRWTGRTAGLALLALLAVACERETGTPPVAERGVLLWATGRHLPPGSQPDRVVARVDGFPITLGEVALCLEREPARSLRECLDLLIDVRLVEATASQEDHESERVEEARLSALASATLRELIDRPLADENLSDEEIERFLQDPANRALFEAPELRRCSHLLIVASPDQQAAALALAEQMACEIDPGSVDRPERLEELRSFYRPTATESGLELRVEEHLLFPPIPPEGTPPLPWLTPAVPEFTQALFDLPAPGSLSAPVQTQYGVHFLLLEEIVPPNELESDQAWAIARHEMGQRRRALALTHLLEELTATSKIELDVRNLEILWQDQEEIIRQRSMSLIESMQRE